MTADADRRGRLRDLMVDHGRVVFGHCVRVLGDSTEAADVLQRVFEEAYRDLDELRDPDRARSWLLAIASHRCLDAIKASKRRAKRFSSWDDETAGSVRAETGDPGAAADTVAVARALDECLDSLGPESRVAVLLRFQRDMSYEEMGRASGEKPGTLQARVARALPVLRRCLEQRGVEP